MRILATLAKPSAGKVSWNGEDTSRRPDPLRAALGYLPQDFGVYPALSAREFLEFLITGGQTEPALLHDLEVATLDPKHVEVVAKAARTVQPLASARDHLDLVASLQVGRRHRLPLDVLEHERGSLRQIRDDARPDTDLRGRDRVVDFVLAVDGEETAVFAGDADDIRAAISDDLVVLVREPAGQRLAAASIPQLGNDGENLVHRHGPRVYLD
jgi:ABC-type Na+ transport system ATPase subunit NatA